MSSLQMMVSKLSWEEQIACESRRQLLADSPPSSRSNDPLGLVDDTPSSLHLLGMTEILRRQLILWVRKGPMLGDSMT